MAILAILECCIGISSTLGLYTTEDVYTIRSHVLQLAWGILGQYVTILDIQDCDID